MKQLPKELRDILREALAEAWDQGFRAGHRSATNDADWAFYHGPLGVKENPWLQP